MKTNLDLYRQMTLEEILKPPYFNSPCGVRDCPNPHPVHPWTDRLTREEDRTPWMAHAAGDIPPDSLEWDMRAIALAIVALLLVVLLASILPDVWVGR
jgi:hypothetical protein